MYGNVCAIYYDFSDKIKKKSFLSPYICIYEIVFVILQREI